jgi:TIR domain
MNMADIFISYSSNDKSKIQAIATILRNNGWSVWWDKDIPAGKTFDSVIEEELNKARCVIVIWTQSSVNSEWVKNEASDALQRKVLVPVMLDEVKLPLAFRRIEAARLINWTGDLNHPELAVLLNAVSGRLDQEERKLTAEETTPAYHQQTAKQANGPGEKEGQYRLLLSKKKLIILGVIILFGLVVAKFFIGGTSRGNVVIKVADRQKKSVEQGQVKLHIGDYTFSRSINSEGEAVFSDISGKSVIQVEVTSPGYTKYMADTVVPSNRMIELVLSQLRLIHITGRVKTAAEMPVKNVEVSVDDTKYYGNSLTDGTYSIQLKDYTIGDRITMTASGNKDYEDKIVLLTITEPDMTVDFVLNPFHR